MDAQVPLNRPDADRGWRTASTSREYACLALIVLVGAFVRTVNVADEALWGDEGLTLIRIQWAGTALLFSPVDPTAGFYYLLQKWLAPDPADLLAVRSISLVAGVLSICAIHAVGKQSFGVAGGLLSAALLALSPPLVDYSQEARAYSTLVFLVLGSAAAFIAWGRRIDSRHPHLPMLLLFGITAVLAFYTHLVSIFWIIPAVAGGAMLVRKRGAEPDKRLYLLTALLMALLAVPEIRRAHAYYSQAGGLGWLEQADPGLLAQTVADAFLPTALWTNDHYSVGPIISGILVASILAAILWRLILNRRAFRDWIAEKPAAALVLGILVSAPLWIWLFGFIAAPIFMPRTILIGIPGFILLLVLLIELDKAWWLAGLFILSFAGALLAAGTVRAKEEWNRVSPFVADNLAPGDAVIVCPAWKYPAFRAPIASPPVMPTLIPFDGELVLVERQAGDSRGWVRDFFAFYQTQNRTSLTLTGIQRVWVIASECQPHSRELIRNRLGQGRWIHAARGKAHRQHEGIEVWLFEMSSQRAVDVVGLP